MPSLEPEYPFLRFVVFKDGPRSTRVEWELSPRFGDPRPHEFELQVAPSSTAGPEEWQPSGLAAENVFTLVDDHQREWGKNFDYHWRLELRTPLHTYHSRAIASTEGLGFREWRLVREMLRQARKRARQFTGTLCSLIKMRRYGPPCTHCIDPFTQAPTTPECPHCFGTGTLQGYYRAVEGLYADLGLIQTREQLDDSLQGDTAKPMVSQVDLHGWPALASRDLVRETHSGRRWLIHTIIETAALRGYPFLHKVELRQLPFSDPLYQVEGES